MKNLSMGFNPSPIEEKGIGKDRDNMDNRDSVSTSTGVSTGTGVRMSDLPPVRESIRNLRSEKARYSTLQYIILSTILIYFVIFSFIIFYYPLFSYALFLLFSFILLPSLVFISVQLFSHPFSSPLILFFQGNIGQDSSS